MKPQEGLLLALTLVATGLGGCKGRSAGPRPRRQGTYADAMVCPDREGPDHAHVATVLHGQAAQTWRLAERGHYSPDTSHRVGDNAVPLPKVQCFYSFIRWEGSAGGVLMHLYARAGEDGRALREAYRQAQEWAVVQRPRPGPRARPRREPAYGLASTASICCR